MKAHGKGDTKSGSCSELARCSSRMSRLQEHIELFVRGSDASEADGLHLAYLLQLELRDVFRHGAEAEAEVDRLRERLEKMKSSKIEKEAIDRQSLAGMALAHADASAELCSHVRDAHDALNQSQAEKDALSNDLNSKADTIAQLERRVAELTTAADVAHDTRMRRCEDHDASLTSGSLLRDLEPKKKEILASIEDLKKSLEEEHRQAVDQVRLTWEQRLATAEEAYTAARRRWEAASRGSHAGLVPSGALEQSHATDDIPRKPADKPDKDNSEQETQRVFNNPVEHHAEFHAKLPTNVCQPSSPPGHICKGRERAGRSADDLPKAPATSNDPHKRRATAPQSLLPPTADVMPTGDSHHFSPTGFARSRGRPSRSTEAVMERLSPEVSLRFESVSRSISRSLSAEVRRSLPTDVSESVSDSALGSAMCRRDGRCCGQCTKLDGTPIEAAHHRQDPDEDSVQVKNLVNLVQPSRNAAGLRGIHRHEPPASSEHRDLRRSGEQPNIKRISPEPAGGAREAINAAADTGGKGRRHLAAADTAMMPIAVREANDSRQTARYSRKSMLQKQHRHQHQPQDPRVSSQSSVVGTAEEQGRTRALTSSVGISGKSEEMTSRSNERSASTSSGCRSWSDTKLPPAGHDNADAHRLRSDSVAESSVECSCFGTNNVSRLIPLCDSHPSLETATYERPGSKSASASGPASSAGYGSASITASQPSPDMVPSSFQSCTSPSISRRGGFRTTGGSQASLESRLCSKPASVVEGSGRFDGGHRSASLPHKGSSWSQAHPSSPRLSDGTNGCSRASAWTETTINNGNEAAGSPSPQTSRSGSDGHARSAATSSRSTSSRRTATILNSNDVKMTRSRDPCVCEEARREGQGAPPPQTATTTTVPLQSWSSQTSSRSKVHHSGSRPEVEYSSNSGKSSVQHPHSAFSHPRDASGEMNSAGTHSGVGGGNGNADSRTSWSAASASDTPLSTRTQSNRSMISMPSSSRESRRAFRQEPIGTNSAGTHSGVGSGDGNADSRASWSVASAADTPLSTQGQSSRSVISMRSSSLESRRAFRQEPLGMNSAGANSGVGSGDDNADSRTSWSAASASDTPLSTHTQSNWSVISMPSSSRESRRMFRREPLGTNSAGTHGGVDTTGGHADSGTSWSAASVSDTPLSTQTQSNRSLISVPSSSRESRRAFRQELVGTNSAGKYSGLGSGDGNADDRTSWSAAPASDTPLSTQTQSNRSVISMPSSSREGRRAFRQEPLETKGAGTHSGVGSRDGNADSGTGWSAASASDSPLSTHTQSNRSMVSMPSSSGESRRGLRQDPLGTNSAGTHSGVSRGDGNADSRTSWSAASASDTPLSTRTQSNRSVISIPSSSRESRRVFREETLGTNSAVGNGGSNADSKTSWSTASASDTQLPMQTQSNKSVISMPSSSRESRRAFRKETLAMYTKTDLESFKRTMPPPPRLRSSRSSMRQSEPRQYSSTAHDSTQPTLQPGNLPRSASNTSYGKGKSVTSETRARSSKLTSYARSSTPTSSSTPTEARLPAPDETSTESIEGGLRSPERISPPPHMNSSTASYASEDIGGVQRNERWAGNVRAPATPHDSRSEVSSKSTNMGQGGWGYGGERAVPPLQPMTLTRSGSPPSSSMGSNERRGERATAGGARFYTATPVPALEDNQVSGRRSGGSLTHIDLQHMDVSDGSEHAPEPPSTITTSNNSDRGTTPSNRGSNRSIRGCESLSSSPWHSISRNTSEKSSAGRNAASARQTLSYSHGSAASYRTTPSVHSLHRSVSDSQSRGETRELDRSERSREGDGTSCSLQGGGGARSSGDFQSGSSFSSSASRSTGGPPVGNIQPRPRRRKGSRSAAGRAEGGTRENRRVGAPDLGSPRSSHEPRLSRSPDHMYGMLDNTNRTVWNAHPNDV